MLDPVPSDSGLCLMPTHTFADCPLLDLICVPGGYRGVIQAMGDRDLIAFMQRQARTAKYVTSVCTGAFILGAAGLLKGRRAATHWGYAELLPLLGATHEKRRVVRDGNLITAGGVTSGIDFGLADIAGEAVARSIQLSLECDPDPPFASGHPDRAATQTLAEVALPILVLADRFPHERGGSCTPDNIILAKRRIDKIALPPLGAKSIEILRQGTGAGIKVEAKLLVQLLVEIGRREPIPTFPASAPWTMKPA
jgi:hypothetical protein